MGGLPRAWVGVGPLCLGKVSTRAWLLWGQLDDDTRTPLTTVWDKSGTREDCAMCCVALFAGLSVRLPGQADKAD